MSEEVRTSSNEEVRTSSNEAKNVERYKNNKCLYESKYTIDIQQLED